MSTPSSISLASPSLFLSDVPSGWGTIQESPKESSSHSRGGATSKKAKRKVSIAVGSKNVADNKKRKSNEEDLICPITLELPLEPVMAEDGRIYEKSAILKHIQNSVLFAIKSPMTNQLMGSRLVPVVQIRNIIETAVENGDVSEELANNYKRRQADQKDVEILMQKGEAGDGNAAYEVARLYRRGGKKGIARDDNKAFYWYHKAADAGNVIAMARYGRHIAGENPLDALVYVSRAVQADVDTACIKLGTWYKNGSLGLTKNLAKAKQLLQRGVSGECTHKSAGDEYVAKGKEALDQLFQEQSL